MKRILGSFVAATAALVGFAAENAATNVVADLGTVTVEGTALSRYRAPTVNGGTFTDVPPEKLPVVVDTLTEDFIQEHNPTDLHDLLRYVPGIETGGKSLVVRQPGIFSIRGFGGTEPTFDGVLPIGRGAGLFMDAFLMERVEIVKGPIGALGGGQGSVQGNNGAGGSINMYLKSATTAKDETNLQGNLSVGRHTHRERGMADVNQTFLDGKGAVRVLTTADYYTPTYINEGSQKGARPRESFSVAPSFVFEPNDEVHFGLKSLFQYTDQPSYIGVPVWHGRPGGGYSWYESSCEPGDRSTYQGFMLNPWLDWQVTEDWLLKFGAAMMVSSWEHTTREPFVNLRDSSLLNNYFNTGLWGYGYDVGEGRYSPKTSTSANFSHAKSVNRNYNVYMRSIYTKDLGGSVTNCFVFQPDYYYREAGTTFGTPTSRYGTLLQDSVSWWWFTLLGGIRYDHFEYDSYTSGTTRYWHQTADAVSPRVGLSIQPLDWFILFGNYSQTRTPTFGYRNADGSSPTSPWIASQYEGGVRISPVDRLWLTVSAYRIEQDNAPVMDTVNDFYTYDGRYTTRGAEVSLTGDITDNWTIMTMYAYNQHTDRTVAPGEKGRDFENYPAHTFSVNTSYRISSGPLEDIVLGAGYRFRSMSYATVRGKYQNENLRLNPSHLVDISATIPFSKFGGSEDWMLTLGIRNLLGEKYFESTRHFYECLVGEPRTFEIGVRARF